MMKFKITETIQDVHTHLALNLEMAKDAGRKVVGCLCSYSPTELILAAGAIPVGLCGTTQIPIAKAEEILSRDQCPKVKSTYGRAISGTCPLFPLADCIIAETTCDGRKKMYELLDREVPLMVMDLPQKPESPAALAHWTSEVRNTKAFLEKQLDVTITDDDLWQAIEKGNRQRRLMTDICGCMRHDPPPVTGLDFVNITGKLRYYVDFEDYIQTLDAFYNELQDCVKTGQSALPPGRPRILWTGLGSSLGCSKVLELVKEFNIDGVIDLAWQFCQPFEIESFRVGELIRDRLGLPFLHVVTDYSESDTEQLRVRIEAFMEQVTAGRTL